MKRLIVSMLLVLFIPSLPYVYADETLPEDGYPEDGYYYETVIEPETPEGVQQSATKTKSKTVYFKNSKGEVQWYVKVTGTFTYGNGSSKCTAVSTTAVSKAASWKISDKSSGRSGNAATAKRHVDGSAAETKQKSVTLKCSPEGKFS